MVGEKNKKNCSVLPVQNKSAVSLQKDPSNDQPTSQMFLPEGTRSCEGHAR